MNQLIIPLPTRFATDCLLGVLYHLEKTYNLTVTGENVVIEGPNPVAALQDIILTAKQILQRREECDKKYRMKIPASGNDRKILSKLFQAFQLPPDASVYQMTDVLAKDPIAASDDVQLPSILKPEFYEFNRMAGYVGESSRRMRQSYPAYVVGLCLTGYLLCRVGYVRLDRQEKVSVLMTPSLSSSSRPFAVDPGYRIAAYLDAISKLEDVLCRQKYRIEGLFPETALHLWLACLIGGVKIKLYAVKEPAGQNPATLFSSMQLDLHPLYKAMDARGLTGENIRNRIINLAQNALNTLEKSLAKSLAIRFSTLLYEVLSGTRPAEEFVYVSNRELMPYLLRGNEAERDASYYVVMDASAIGHRIWRSTLMF
ncbi:MAG: hypothetical protein QXR26_06310 [Candidatus Caldarchaeum sp.]